MSRCVVVREYALKIRSVRTPLLGKLGANYKAYWQPLFILSVPDNVISFQF